MRVKRSSILANINKKLEMIIRAHNICMSLENFSVISLGSSIHTYIYMWLPGQEDPLRRKWHPTPVFLHAKSHGQRSPVGGLAVLGVAKSLIHLSN